MYEGINKKGTYSNKFVLKPYSINLCPITIITSYKFVANNIKLVTRI